VKVKMSEYSPSLGKSKARMVASKRNRIPSAVVGDARVVMGTDVPAERFTAVLSMAN
jgi:hypothetical protein